MAIATAISRIFYKRLNQGARHACHWPYSRMDQFMGTVDLRNLFSLAAMLQRLASDSLCRDDQPLYLLTAEALEGHAGWLAATLPQENAEPPSDPGLHNPVDVTI